MHTYSAYGLCVDSSLPLPELAPGRGPADVRISTAVLRPPPLTFDGRGFASMQTPEGIWLAWDDVGVFLVHEGHNLTVSPSPGVDEAVVRLFTLGPAMGMLLYQQGLLVLHASSVAMGDGVVAFLGEKGWGKSTTAGVLQARGHRLLSDDILALRGVEEGAPEALPGFPQLRLWPDAVAALGADPKAMPRLRPDIDKRGYCTVGFAQEPLPLQQIYVLGGGPELAIEPVRSSQAFFQLMRHVYPPRFLGETASAHFELCAALARRISIYHLRRPRNLARLPDLARLIEEHAGAPAIRGA